jgi:hypothetical protein
MGVGGWGWEERLDGQTGGGGMGGVSRRIGEGVFRCRMREKDEETDESAEDEKDEEQEELAEEDVES